MSENGAQREDSPDGVGLTEKERSQTGERARPNALVVHEIIREEGERELRRPVTARCSP